MTRPELLIAFVCVWLGYAGLVASLVATHRRIDRLTQRHVNLIHIMRRHVGQPPHDVDWGVEVLNDLTDALESDRG